MSHHVSRRVIFRFRKNGVEHFNCVSLCGAEQSRLYVRVMVIHCDPPQRLTRTRIVPFTKGQGQLVSHANAGILDELQQCGCETSARAVGRGCAQQWFAETQGEFSHRRVGISQAGRCDFWRDHPQRAHRTERLDARLGVRVVRAEALQLGLRRIFGAPKQHSLGHVAFPAIGTCEALNQVRRAKLVQPRNAAQLRALRIDAVNATLVIARPEVRPSLQLLRKILRMLDDATVDVGNVKSAVGAGLEHGGAKPVVARREKFAVLFIGCATAGEGGAIGFQNFTMHNILGRLTDKNAGGKIGSEQGVAIRCSAVRRSQTAGCVRPVESLLRPADGENARRVRIVRQDPAHRGHRQIGIARQILLRQEVVP